jgi:hypothetical protein
MVDQSASNFKEKGMRVVTYSADRAFGSRPQMKSKSALSAAIAVKMV